MPIPQANPDRLNLRFGGGLMSLFGLPFLLAGLGVIAAAFAVKFGALNGDMPLYFGLPFGAVFALIGYCLVFGRSGIQADYASGEIVKWWGFPMPVRRTTYAIKSARDVRIAREVRRSDKSSYVVFPVYIEFDGDESLKVSEPRQEQKTRQTAEQVAEFLRLPLADATSGAVVTRSHDELDLNVKQRFRQGRLEAVIPDIPVALKSRIDFDGSKLAIDIPPAGPQPAYLIALLALLGFGGFVNFVFFIPFFSQFEMEGMANWLPIAFAALFLAVPGLAAVRLLAQMFFVRESISATSHGVEFRRGWIARRCWTLSAEQIEEIELGVDSNARRVSSRSQRAIAIRTDERTIRVGRHLKEEEKAYLLALLRAVLVS